MATNLIHTFDLVIPETETTISDANMPDVPRIGEQIKMTGNLYEVRMVRYIAGPDNPQIFLKQIKTEEETP